MKPRKLVMSAFGSYGGVETIQFDQVDHGLFLISGDTGSGKSTIFDALMFALYDTMSGKERKGHMMRSEYASEDAETFVEFTFSYGTASQAEVYTVKRYPAYERKAKRRNKQGEYGVTKQPARVTLILPDGTEFLGKISETNKKIQEIVGLTAEQFSKMAMIAQGEFQDLIMDKTGKRKEIFQQIFSTEIYETIEKKILERYKKSLALVQTNTTQLRETVNGVFFSSAEEQEMWENQLEYLETDAGEIQRFLQDSVKKTKSCREAQKRKVEGLEKECSQLSNEYHEFERLNQDIDRWEYENKIHQELLAEKKTIECLQEESELAKKAEQVLQSEENLMRCQKELCKTKKDKEMQERQAEQLKVKSQEALLVSEEKKTAREKRQPEIVKQEAQLEEALENLSELLLCKQQIEQYQKQYGKEKKGAEDAKNFEASLQKEKEELEVWLAQNENLEVLIQQQMQEIKELQEIQKKQEKFTEDYRKLCQTEVLHREKEKALLQAVRDWEQCRREHEEKSRAYIAAQSSFLAMELSEGEPCPVCGATQHPKPATPTDSTVTREAFEASAKKEETAQREKERCQGELNKCQVLLEKMTGDLWEAGKQLFCEIFSESQAETFKETILTEKKKWEFAITKQTESTKQELAVLEEKVEEGKEKQEQKIEKKKKAAGMQERIQKEQKNCQECEVRMHQTELKLKELEKQEELQRRKVTIATRREGEEKLQALKEEEKNLAAEVAQAEENAVQWKRKCDNLHGNLEETQKRLERLVEEEVKGQKTFAEKLLENGFSDKETYGRALSLRDSQEERERQIQNYHERKVTNDTRLQDLKKRIDGREKKPLDLLLQQLTMRQQQKEQEELRLQDISHQYRTNYDVLLRVTKLLNEQEDLLEDKKVIASLNQVANGKVHFQTYVQRQYFKKIIQAANRRLQKMTSNQFLLKCRELEHTGQGEGGLDLDVYNPVTGKSRDAHTLSGGETFLASLAMALGMADVVQNTIGKTHLDTMFIDEGFGSLSDEVRNTAVRVLLELAGDNRLIGVISHVSELKEQIPYQLRVTKGNQGSKVSWRNN